MSATIRIRALARGPLVVEPCGAALEVLGPDGAPLDVSAMRKLRFCRCGASGTPPLCDGAHNRTAFEAPQIGPDE